MAYASDSLMQEGYSSRASSLWFCFATISPAYNTIVETIVPTYYKYS